MDVQETTTGISPDPALPAVTRSGVGRLGTIGVLAVTAVLIVAASVVTNGGAVEEEAGSLTPVALAGGARGPAPVVGQPAPNLSAPAADGSIVALGDFAGKPVWLTFGASWCQPCRAENPDIVAAYERHRASGLVVVQVYMGEDAATVTDYTTRVGIPYVTVPDPRQQLANDYRILGIPSHYFIDASGTLRAMRIGSLSPSAMDEAIAEIGG